MGSTFNWNGKLSVPTALRLGHDKARAELVRAMKEDSPIAEAAERVAKMCLPHFEREEQSVFPVLAFLPDLTQGILRPEMADVLPLISDFRARHEALDSQHQSILSAIEDLLRAANKEKDEEVSQLAYNMKVHERIEDEVIYPTVLLIGNHLRAVAPGIWTAR
jgi:hypothetical protein